MTSPSWMLISGIMPPSAVNESCMALTAPHEPAVVMTANSAEATRPKRMGKGRADGKDRDHMHEVRERGRILERVRRVGVEEAAAVGAEHLDGDRRGDRADRDGLLGAFQGGGVDIGAERLGDSLPHQ